MEERRQICEKRDDRQAKKRHSQMRRVKTDGKKEETDR